MTSAPKPWYSYKGKKYDGPNPPYYYLDGVAWYDKLKQHIPAIKERILEFLKIDELDIRQYFNTSMVEGTKWEAVSFMFWGLKNDKVTDVIPDKGESILQYFRHIPGLVSLSVSILQPQTRIKGHHGDTDAIYRMHIPILIPAQLPDCGFKVGGIERPWLDGEIIVFCDACYHEAWNMTDKPRVVVILDVIKEEFLPQKNKICANVLSFIKYQHVTMKLKFIRKFPGKVKNMIRESLKLYPNEILRE